MFLSREAWIIIAAQGVPLLLGLFFGMPAFVVSFAVGNAVLLYRYRDRRTPEDRRFDIVERQAEKLSRTNPAAADAMLDAYFQEAAERSARERATLRSQAAADVQAAKRLAALLRQEIDSHRLMRDRFLSQVGPEERVTAEAMIEKREQQTQMELEQLEETIRRLKG
jgi:hypothetical protein